MPGTVAGNYTRYSVEEARQQLLYYGPFMWFGISLFLPLAFIVYLCDTNIFAAIRGVQNIA